MKTIVCLTVILAASLTAVGLCHAEPAMPDSIVRVGACRPLGWPWGVFVQGDYAYVAGRSYLSVIDISVPSTPAVVGSLRTFDIQPVAVFVQDTVAHTVQIGPEFATASVGDPTSPYQLGWCPIPMFSVEPKGLMVVGSLAYVPDANRGLQVVDVSDPTAPAVIGSLDTDGIARDLHVRDTLVFVADGDSLQVVNVSDPTLPSGIGAVEMPNTCYDVFVVDTFAYVACQTGFGFGSLEVVNVSDPSSPQIVASVDNIAGDPLDVWISGSYAYVAAADYSPIEGGVRVIDISNPLNPSLVASYDTPGNPRGLFAVDDLVFVADYDSLQILRHIVVGVEESAPARSKKQQLRLLQNGPNPFSDRTSISYQLPADARVLLSVHDVCGRLIASLVDEQQHAGFHTLHWKGKSEDGTTLPSGVYFFRLTTQGSRRCGKMILLR